MVIPPAMLVQVINPREAEVSRPVTAGPGTFEDAVAVDGLLVAVEVSATCERGAMALLVSAGGDVAVEAPAATVEEKGVRTWIRLTGNGLCMTYLDGVEEAEEGCEEVVL